MSEIVVVGSLKARPGKEDEALAGLVTATHAEDGCHPLPDGDEHEGALAAHR